MYICTYGWHTCMQLVTGAHVCMYNIVHVLACKYEYILLWFVMHVRTYKKV